MISISHKGDFKKTQSFLEKIKDGDIFNKLDHYGQMGVEALAAATPIDSGKTASSWTYKIVKSKQTVSIQWSNTNVNKGVPIAIILQYGHATGTGGYVQGRDYINPALKPIFDEIEENVWKEMTRN